MSEVTNYTMEYVLYIYNMASGSILLQVKMFIIAMPQLCTSKTPYKIIYGCKL